MPENMRGKTRPSREGQYPQKHPALQKSTTLIMLIRSDTDLTRRITGCWSDALSEFTCSKPNIQSIMKLIDKIKTEDIRTRVTFRPQRVSMNQATQPRYPLPSNISRMSPSPGDILVRYWSRAWYHTEPERRLVCGQLYPSTWCIL
jgi:hypothetical protein